MNRAADFISRLPEKWFCDVSGTAVRTMLCIASHSEDGQVARIPAKNMATELRKKLRAVYRAVAELEEAGYLERRYESGESAAQWSNTYRVPAVIKGRKTRPRRYKPNDSLAIWQRDAHGGSPPSNVREYMFRDGGDGKRPYVSNDIMSVPPAPPPRTAKGNPTHHHHSGANASGKRGGGGESISSPGREEEQLSEQAREVLDDIGYTVSRIRAHIRAFKADQVERNILYYARARKKNPKLGPGLLDAYIREDQAAETDKRRSRQASAKVDRLAEQKRAREAAPKPPPDKPISEVLGTGADLERHCAIAKTRISGMPDSAFYQLCEEAIRQVPSRFLRERLIRTREKARDNTLWLGVIYNVLNPPSSAQPAATAAGT